MFIFHNHSITYILYFDEFKIETKRKKRDFKRSIRVSFIKVVNMILKIAFLSQNLNYIPSNYKIYNAI